MKKRLALMTAVIFIWGVMAPLAAEAGTAYESLSGVKPPSVNPKIAYRTSESTKHSIAGVFASRKQSGLTYKKGQVIIKVKNTSLLNKKLEEKWNLKIEKQLMNGMVLASFDESRKTMERMITDLNKSQEIYFAEPNYSRKITSFSKSVRKVSDSNWWYRNAKIESAWNISKGSSEVVVGVMDTGVDYNHEDLKDNIYVNKDEISGDNIDNDKNGYVDDVYGYDFGDGDSNPMDISDHGTHVAGIIAAENNGIGITGVAPEVKILPLKLSNSKDETMLVSAEIEAIIYARRMGVEIFNCSFGSFETDPAEYEIIKNNPEVMFICAAGNGDEVTHIAVNTDATPHYPSDYDLSNIISVAAVGENGLLTTYSDFGQNTVDLGAPGDEIYSTVQNNQYDYLSGTSMATPFVTGAFALMRSVNPFASVVKLKEDLLASVNVVDSLRNKLTTGGSLDVLASVSRAKANLVPVTGVEINESKLSIYTGTESMLEAVILPSRMKTKTVLWSSENPLIATVDGNGNVKGLSKGSVEIKATEKTTGFYKSCIVNVIDFLPPVLKVGKSVNLSFKTPKFIEGTARLWLIRPDGTEDSFDMKLDRGNKKYTVSIQSDKDGYLTSSELDPFKYYGTWEIEMIEVVDENKTVFNFYNNKYFDGNDEKHIPMNFETYKFIVEDNYHPSIDTSQVKVEGSIDKSLAESIVSSAIERGADEVLIGNILNLKVFAKAKTGIYTAYVTYVKPDGNEIELNFGINARGSYYYDNIPVTEKAGSDDYNIDGINDAGQWMVKEIRLLDMARNSIYLKDRRYSSEDGVDLSGLDFSVQSEQVRLKGIHFEQSSLILKKGRVFKPAIFADSANISVMRTDLIYKSTNPKVATINTYGVITTKKPGVTVIKATLKKDSNIVTSIKVVVK